MILLRIKSFLNLKDIYEKWCVFSKKLKISIMFYAKFNVEHLPKLYLNVHIKSKTIQMPFIVLVQLIL
jgi:hypothetical protein